MYRDRNHQGTGSREKDEEGLTKVQRELLAFIEATIRKTGFPPSIGEMLSHMRWASNNSPMSHLKALQAAGKIRRDLRGRIFVIYDGFLVQTTKQGIWCEPPRKMLSAEEAQRLAELLLAAAGKEKS